MSRRYQAGQTDDTWTRVITQRDALGRQGSSWGAPFLNH